MTFPFWVFWSTSLLYFLPSVGHNLGFYVAPKLLNIGYRDGSVFLNSVTFCRRKHNTWLNTLLRPFFKRNSRQQIIFEVIFLSRLICVDQFKLGMDFLYLQSDPVHFYLLRWFHLSETLSYLYFSGSPSTDCSCQSAIIFLAVEKHSIYPEAVTSGTRLTWHQPSATTA